MRIVSAVGSGLASLVLCAAAATAQEAPPAGDAGELDPAGVSQAVQQPEPASATFEPGGGNEWFEATRLDLGTFFSEEEAVGVFKFQNPRDVIHKLSNFQGSCTCTKAIIYLGEGEDRRKYVYDSDKVLSKITVENGIEQKQRVSHINVDPGEKGRVQVHMTMGGIKGIKDADLSIALSDSQLPLVDLKWRATGATYFVVDPPDVNLNEMTWSDKREFEFQITSPIKKDFNLLSHEPLPAKMAIEYEKEMRDGQAVWHVKGSYGPGVDERDGGGAITFNTDVEGKTVTARVVAFVKGPLEMKPGGFVSLGHVPAGQSKHVDIEITPNDNFDLQVTKLETERLSVEEEHRDQLAITSHKNGKTVKVRIAILPDMPRSIVRGTLKIHLNHPSARLKEVMFNGFVR